MHTSSVAYADYLNGATHRAPPTHPLAVYMAERGARVRTNVFHDNDLTPGESPLITLRRILASGRRQGFERLDVRIPRDLARAYGLLAAQLMVLERVVIDAHEDGDSLVFRTFYPDVIWQEEAYWRARGRTSLHPKHLTESELSVVRAAVSLPDRTSQQEQLLVKAVDEEA